MINLKNISLRRGQRTLFQDINWTIYHKQHIGIIGANGSGKTTLFSLLRGELHAEGGDLEIPSQLKLAHVAQETPAYKNSALDFVLDGDVELRLLQQSLEEAEAKNDGHRIAVIHERLNEIDAYSAEARAAQLLDGLGFSYDEQLKSVSAFSGGWRVRLNLAQALMCRSDVLLLDEPTNHLDLDAVLWLERWLMKYPGTLLLISHDRDFLDRVVDHIAHLSHQELKIYTGNYSAFEKQRAEQLLLQQAAFEKQQKHIAHLQAFINRFKAKASKARQAQSRMKAIARMELVSAVQTESEFQFSFKEPAKCPNPLIRLDEAQISYGERIILNHLNFSITPSDRIALLGPNGAGKSSLVKLLAGELSPSTGVREVGSGLKIGYFAQHQVDHLNLSESPLHHLRAIAPKTSEQELRNYLGSFGFSGDRILEEIENFSGGEKSRLALALIVWQQPNLLLLDEPTNHLDLEMRQALNLALQEYQGAMILVSHDRFLVRSTVDRLMLVAEGKLKSFDGDINDYEQWLFEYRRQSSSPKETAPQPITPKKQKELDEEQRELRRPLLQQIKKLETDLERCQKKINNVEALLANAEIYEEKNKEQLQKSLLEQAQLKKQIQAIEDEWLNLQSKLSP